MTPVTGERLGQEGTSVRIRPLSAADAPAAHRILMESPEASMWGVESLQESATREIALVAELEGGLAGFLVGRVVADECEILNLAVSQSWRRRGAAANLVRAAVERAQAAGAKRVYLEVRASNQAAIALYKSMSFHERGRRSNYYRDPVEDAVLLVFHNRELEQ